MSRWNILLPALLLLIAPMNADAQGRGNGNGNGNGPAFCRNGQGHPVYGWEWCRQKGWGDDRRVDSRRSGNRSFRTPGFENGFADGYEKGINDGDDRREFNPTRHSWYRSANRHYESRYGSKSAYANVYRDGFRSGYEDGYRDGQRYRDRDRSSGSWWPF